MAQGLQYGCSASAMHPLIGRRGLRLGAEAACKRCRHGAVQDSTAYSSEHRLLRACPASQTRHSAALHADGQTGASDQRCTELWLTAVQTATQSPSSLSPTLTPKWSAFPAAAAQTILPGTHAHLQMRAAHDPGVAAATCNRPKLQDGKVPGLQTQSKAACRMWHEVQHEQDDMRNY